MPCLVYIVQPCDLAAASQVCEDIHAPGLRHATFVFTRGDSDFFDRAIACDAADWPPALMEQGGKVADVLLEAWVSRLHRPIDHFRFYLHHTPEDIRRIAEQHGATVERLVPPQDLVRSGNAPSMVLPELNDPFSGPYEAVHLRLADEIAESLQTAGFQETRAWNQALQTVAPSGIAMHPIAVGKRLGDSVTMTIGVDCSTPQMRAAYQLKTSALLPKILFRIALTIRGAAATQVNLVAAADDHQGVLTVITSKHEQFLQSGNLSDFVLSLFEVAQPVLLELGENLFAKISRDKLLEYLPA